MSLSHRCELVLTKLMTHETEAKTDDAPRFPAGWADMVRQAGLDSGRIRGMNFNVHLEPADQCRENRRQVVHTGVAI